MPFISVLCAGSGALRDTFFCHRLSFQFSQSISQVCIFLNPLKSGILPARFARFCRLKRSTRRWAARHNRFVRSNQFVVGKMSRTPRNEISPYNTLKQPRFHPRYCTDRRSIIRTSPTTSTHHIVKCQRCSVPRGNRTGQFSG